MDAIEKKIDEVLVKNAPVQIPENGKKWIVEYGPYITVVFGLLGLLAAWRLWDAAYAVNDLANTIDAAYKQYNIKTTLYKDANIGATFWVAWTTLLAQSVISVAAFPGLKERSKKRGWDLLFFSAIISLVSGLFHGIYYSSFISIIMRVIGSIIGFYILFQIRSYYTGKAAKKDHEVKTADKSSDK